MPVTNNMANKIKGVKTAEKIVISIAAIIAIKKNMPSISLRIKKMCDHLLSVTMLQS